MDSLEWSQVTDGVNVTVISEDGSKGCFALKNDVINFLWAGTPRIYFVFAKFSDSSQEKCYMLNLTEVKPVILRSNGLKVSLSRKIADGCNSGKTIVGRCCIARGESYHDRFLKDGQWQSQKVWFDMYSSDKQEVEKPSEPEKQPEMPEEKPSGKLKICPDCGEIYPSSLAVCPFCQNKKKTAGDNEDVDLDLS